MSDQTDAGSAATGVAAILNEGMEQPAAEPAAPESEAAADADSSLLSELTNLLEPETVKPAAETVTGEPEKVESLNLNAVAEKLGVEADELYSIEVPMPDGGDAQTLGSLKDAAIELERSKVERLEFDEQVTVQNNAIANAREELAQLVRMLPETARTPQMLEAARAEVERVRETQLQDLMLRIPTWKDQAAKAADMEVITPHLEPFGFKASELDAVYDARLLAYVRHNALREQKLAEMLSGLRAKRKPGRNAGGRRAVTAEKPAPSGNKRDAVISGVTQILRET